MLYRVVITTNAKNNLRDYYARAALAAPSTAERWLSRFESALESLSRHPERCGLAPENDAVAPLIRQLLFGRGVRIFRVLFTIREDEVQILHIRRGTMTTADAADVFAE